MKMAKKTSLPAAAVERVLRKGGVSRASGDSVEEMALVLEEIGGEISRKAWELAAFARRKTVKAEDVRLAFQQ